MARLLGPRARIVWSGQHWDPALTTTFFAQYGLPRPHHLLKGVGGEPRGRQIGRMVSALSDHLAARPPAAVLVQGDTNTAAAVTPGGYVLATIHRPENTDDAARLAQILDQLAALDLPVLLPLHPRTRAAVEAFGLRGPVARLRRIEPLDHAGFLALARHCRLLVSDSGGVQEECTVLKRPLVVVRNSTERPEAVRAGFARLARPGHELARALRELLADEAVGERLAQLPSPYGDGRASAEIVAAVRSRYLAPEPRTEQHTDQRPEPDRTPVAAAATGVGGHR
ncbi:UDP-N-acetyl glucosamine 2-epimerase [Kitasatospora sp. NPDC056273]|uniref:UDP-N-acetyl glucosamine 2-epimerase n=1 Tax=Kitasatospora sp. NPDC056273 TaxID=3345769 RepID=UPI0035D7FD60